MIKAITSVTLAVSDLDSSLRLFRERLGLAVVIDGHASVGLLAAWGYPVHESVRLVELAAADAMLGHIRLAAFEDAEAIPQAPVPRAGGASHGPAAQVAGAVAIAFRGSGRENAFILSELEGLPELLVAGGMRDRSIASHRRAPPSAPTTFDSVWVLAGPSPLANRFYVEALGFSAAALPASLPAYLESALRSILEIPPGSSLQATTYRTPGGRRGDVVLIRSSAPCGAFRPRRVGEPGINLVSFECDSLDELSKCLGALALEPLAPPSHVALPDGRPGKVMVVRGPSAELFEFIEPGD